MEVVVVFGAKLALQAVLCLHVKMPLRPSCRHFARMVSYGVVAFCVRVLWSPERLVLQAVRESRKENGEHPTRGDSHPSRAGFPTPFLDAVWPDVYYKASLPSGTLATAGHPPNSWSVLLAAASEVSRAYSLFLSTAPFSVPFSATFKRLYYFFLCGRRVCFISS